MSTPGAETRGVAAMLTAVAQAEAHARCLCQMAELSGSLVAFGLGGARVPPDVVGVTLTLSTEALRVYDDHVALGVRVGPVPNLTRLAVHAGATLGTLCDAPTLLSLYPGPGNQWEVRCERNA